MEQVQWVNVADLVDKEFVVQDSFGFKWQKWDDNERKMLKSSEYFDGAHKVYFLKTDLGSVGISESVFNDMLNKVNHKGKSDIIDRKFKLTTNGKEGKDKRYRVSTVNEKVAQELTL